MIDVSGDIIYFDGRPVGIIIIPSGTMRDRFEEALTYDADAEVEELERELSQAQDKIDEAIDYINDSENVEIDKIEKILS